MSGQAEHTEVKHGSLDDQEVATLLRTMQAAQFTKSEKVEKPSTEFKPRTLVEIAFEAEERLKAEQERLTQERAHAAALKQAEDERARADAEQNDAPLTQSTESEHPSLEPGAGQQDTSSEPISSHAEPQAEEHVQPEQTHVEMVAEADMKAALESLEARLREEFEAEKATLTEQHFQRGFDAGTQAAKSAEPTEEEKAQLAEQEERHKNLVALFERAISDAASPDNIDASAFSEAINQAVLRLASERAGIAITENPEGFASRISALIDNIRHQDAAITVHLNPDDKMAMTDWIEQHAVATRTWHLAADPKLQHADIRIEVGGITLSERAGQPEDELTHQSHSLSDQAQTNLAEPAHSGQPDEAPLSEAQPDEHQHEHKDTGPQDPQVDAAQTDHDAGKDESSSEDVPPEASQLSEIGDDTVSGHDDMTDETSDLASDDAHVGDIEKEAHASISEPNTEPNTELDTTPEARQDDTVPEHQPDMPQAHDHEEGRDEK